MSKIAVIGGGIIGASAAYHLAKDGVDVLLFDGNDSGKATSAGAGIVAPGTSLRPLPPFFRFAKPAVTYYPDLVDQLHDLDVGDPGYNVCGKLMVANTPAKTEEHPQLKELFEQRRDSGMPNIGDISDISPEEARRMLPILGNVHAAMFIAAAARVDGARLRDTLIAAAIRLGATVVRETASLATSGDRVTGVTSDDQQFAVDGAIVAAGAWSNTVLAPTGFRLALEPQKGQIIHIDLPDQDVSGWPILDWRGSQYQLSFEPNRVVCGATREHGSGYDTRVTPGGIQEILDEQLGLCPGLSNGTIAEIRVGLRPYSEDLLPFIGTIPGFGNLVVGTGHGPSGLQLGPYSGLIAAELVQGKAPSADIADFRPNRPISKLEA